MAIKNISFSRKNSLKIGLILTLSTSISTLSLASDPYDDPLGTGIKTSYSASQSLPNLSPDRIAADVEERFDPLTGRKEYIAQDFDPFEQDSRIAGSARLRSALSGLSRDGANVSGGAYIDVMVMYTSSSRDSWDVKGYEHSVYMNGQPVDIMNYNAMTLDCTRDISRVAYDDSYYRGDNYGRVGGIFRPYPRYRGASAYYRQCDQIRYGAWRGQRDNYRNYSGYDGRRNGSLIRELIESGVIDNGTNVSVGGNNGGNSVVDGGQNNNGEENLTPEQIRERILQRDLALRLRDQESLTSRNVIRPDLLGERRLTNPPSGVDPRPIGSAGVGTGGSTGVSAGTGVGNTPMITPPSYGGRALSPISANPNYEVIGRTMRNREDLARVSSGSGVPRLGNATPRLPNVTPRISVPAPVTRSAPETRPVPVTRSAPRPISRPTPSRPTVSRPTVSRPSAPVAAPVSRPSLPASPPASSSSSSRSSRPAPRPTRPTRSAPKPTPKPVSRPAPRRSTPSRPTSRPSTPSRIRRYYPGNNVYPLSNSQNRCVKEERVTLHIPAERLEAARFDGLSLVLLDKDGGDIPVYIPPNYIAGFMQANPYLNSYNSGVQAPYNNGGYSHGAYPTNPGN